MSGDQQTIYYVEVSDDMKVSEGKFFFETLRIELSNIKFCTFNKKSLCLYTIIIL
jgi:hypothetical protein